MRLEDLTAFFIIENILSCSKLNYYEIPQIFIATKRQSIQVRLKQPEPKTEHSLW